MRLYCGFDCLSKTNDLSTMVRKRTNKRGPRRQRSLPSQEVPPPRRRESPRRSGSSVQDDSDDRILPTSPPPGNEKEIVNIQVSPNDPSLDSQANNWPRRRRQQGGCSGSGGGGSKAAAEAAAAAVAASGKPELRGQAVMVVSC